MRWRRATAAVAALAMAAGGWLVGEQLWLGAKARLAELLIDRAFERHLRDGEPHAPWSWADTHPVARLEVPRLGVRRTVLAGASGSSLAFGPGHIDGTTRPNGDGNCVIAGHRDGWFAFLERLRTGDRIRLQTLDGVRDYEVTGLRVVSMWDAEVVAQAAPRQLTLVTCWPFGGLRPTPWRWVVTCEPSAGGRSALHASTSLSTGGWFDP